MKVPDSVIRSARFQSMPAQEQLAIMRLWLIEDADIRDGMRQDRAAVAQGRCTCDASGDVLPIAHRPWCGTEGEPWCPDHGYGCEPSNCPCGHTLRCDCVSIQNEH